MADIDPLAFQRGFQGALNIADTARQNRLAQLVFDQKQQELADQQSTNNALSAFYQRGDTPESRQQLYGQLPGSKIIATQKTLTEADTARQAQQKAQRDQLIAQFDWADKNMAAVQDQAGWDAFRQRAATVYPDIAAKLPAVYDPAAVAASRAKAIPVLEQWKAENTANENRLNREATASNSAANRAATAEQGALNREATAEQGRLNREANAAKAAADKAPTEFQGKSAGYGARAEEADRIIGSLANASPMAVNAKQAAGRVPLVGGVLETIGNAALSPQNQQLEQAQRDFVNATLRQESGAAISQGEFENAKRQYFPQPGDSAEVIAQKAANRKLAIEGFKRSAGKAAFSAPGGKPKPSLADIFGN